ncbi:MAG: mannose-1-phosphate guanylyltransferase, partial [Clostridiales bacterium]|nr:mannose-1-phosphate guanylyltransferase [Clostridiales bacterium]
EPMQKNTAISICYAAFKIIKKYGDAVMVITPSDAYIKEQKKFENILLLATQKAKSFDGIITIGIKPTYASTGYGYIKYEKSSGDFFKVLQFTEKPKKELAKRYLSDKNYLWNSGIFICKASVILSEIQRFLPKIYNGFTRAYNLLDTEKEGDILLEIYKGAQSVSIDYAVIENAKNMLVIYGDFGWSDLGSWEALSAIKTADKYGNVSIGNVISVEAQNNLGYSTDKLIVLFGVNNLVVAQTKTAILVCEKQRSQNIKDLLKVLEKNEQGDYL